jgi:O6-methylguanine-DNA--protein-cysteine methyltransferase
MSHNPLQLLVPCHRVLPSPDKKGNSKSGNYAFGCKNIVKQWLLKHEGRDVNGDIVIMKN